MSVLIVGSVGIDTITTPVGTEKDVLGGSAVYSSISCGCFVPVKMVGVAGDDFPDLYKKLLKRRNIDLEGLEIKEGKETFRWEGFYGKDFGDAKTISTELNVLSEFDPTIPESYKDSKYIFLANADPVIQEKVLSQVANPEFVMCDTMNFWIENKKEDLKRLLKKIDFFVLNGSEATLLTGEKNIVKAAEVIKEMGPKHIIIKKGEHGAIFFSENDIFAAPALLLESIVDPTGAGDTFAGGVVGYLAKTGQINNKNLRNAVISGIIMATFAVEDFSLKRLATVKDSDIEERFEKFRKLVEF